ncbi:MAG: hypothetical protein H7Z16_04125 [Pyrinomonadaceae bacterium]|nr:hypothetical protein [Pyrinomonadaceae bacterium]
MSKSEATDLQSNLADVRFCAFALSDCLVHVPPQSAKFLRAVHRTALELAVPNLFGLEIGGYWLTPEQIHQLQKLPECYPANEVDLVEDAIEAFLLAQTEALLLPGVFYHSETSPAQNPSLSNDLKATIDL